jgi:hypothetical protein
MDTNQSFLIAFLVNQVIYSVNMILSRRALLHFKDSGERSWRVETGKGVVVEEQTTELQSDRTTRGKIWAIGLLFFRQELNEMVCYGWFEINPTFRGVVEPPSNVETMDVECSRNSSGRNAF